MADQEVLHSNGYTYGGDSAEQFRQFNELDPERLQHISGPNPSSLRIGFLCDSLNSQAALLWRKVSGESSLPTTLREVIERWEASIVGIFSEITQWTPFAHDGVALKDALRERVINQLQRFDFRQEQSPLVIRIDPFNFDPLDNFPVFNLQATRACPVVVHNGEPIPLDSRIKSVPRRPDAVEVDERDGNGRSVDQQIDLICRLIERLQSPVVLITEDIIERGELTQSIIRRIREYFPEVPIEVHCNVSSLQYAKWAEAQNNLSLHTDMVEPFGTLLLDMRSQKFSGRSVGYHREEDDTCWPAYVTFKESQSKITLCIPYALDLERYGDIGDKETPETRRACKALFFRHAFLYLDTVEAAPNGKQIVLDDLACPYIRYDLPIGIGTDLNLLAASYKGSDPLKKYISDFFRQEILVELFDEILTAASGSDISLPDSLEALRWCSTDMVCEQELREIYDVLAALSDHFFAEYLIDGRVPNNGDLMQGECRLALIRNILQRGYQELPAAQRQRLDTFLDDRVTTWLESTDFETGSSVDNHSRIFTFPFIDPLELTHLKTDAVSSIALPTELKSQERPEVQLRMVEMENGAELVRVLEDTFLAGNGNAIAQVTSPLTFPSSINAVDSFVQKSIEYTHAFYYLIYDGDRPVGLINARGIKRVVDTGNIECTFGTVIFDPEDRGAGIGRHSKKLLFQALVDAGVRKISSKVLDENDPRIAKSLEVLGLNLMERGLDPNGRPYSLYVLTSER